MHHSILTWRQPLVYCVSASHLDIGKASAEGGWGKSSPWHRKRILEQMGAVDA